MKKIALILAAVMMMTALAACGGGAAETTAPVETTAPAVAAPQDALSDLFVKLYEQVPVELPVGDFPVDLADDYAVKTYVGADSAEGITEALTSESMIGAQAYFEFMAGNTAGMELNAMATMPLDRSFAQMAAL